MDTTARFKINRKRDLERCFKKEKITRFWRKIVRPQLRNMEILDLHDYYDFNYTIDKKAIQITEDILSGKFTTSQPLIYKIEKKYGICRHLMIPAPTDALVFQTIVESISEAIHKSAPSKKAYYSRDKHNLKLPHEQREQGEYPWLIQWKNFQRDIYKFSNNYPYLVITDLSNFFDSIGLKELRHVISSGSQVPEVILDIVFKMIEELSWSPDYLPRSFKGLPTINIEAIRLLAHSLLFEIDEILNEKTKGSFVRWMDDINFGINSKKEGSLILGELNDVLKSRGLALNLSKTKIISASDAKKHFLFDENTFLDNYKDTEHLKPEDLAVVKKRFKSHLDQNSKYQNYNKVTKRYITLFGKTKTNYSHNKIKKLFLNTPSLRKNISYYILNSGFSKGTSSLILELLSEVTTYDDVTLFYIAKTITDLEIPRTSSGKNFINEVFKITNYYSEGFSFYCRIWIAAKYGHPKDVLKMIVRNEKKWSKNSFLSRQIISTLPRVININRTSFDRYIVQQLKYGFSDSSSVAENIQSLTQLTKIPPKLRLYLLSTKPQRIFPLAKFLISLSVLQSQIDNKNDFKESLLSRINDPYYRYWINEISSED